MADKTGISWTDATWSPVVGCTRVSEGCRNCYSERLVATRLRHTEKYSGLAQMTQAGPRWTNVVRCVDGELLKPLSWKKPRRIFVNSMSDTFHREVPFEFIDKMFAAMALCPQHTFQVLTKRPERAAEYFDTIGQRIRSEADLLSVFLDTLPPGTSVTVAEYRRLMSVLPNVWVGTSVEDQTAANERIPYLLKVPAAVRFLSCEPLLGSVDLTAIDFGGIFGPTDVLSGRNSPSGRRLLHWVICGGESGPKARPMHPDWARSLRDQCAAAGVPFHHKQNGEWRFAAGGNLDPGTFAMWPDGHLATAFSGQGDRNPKACLLTRKVGTKNTGRLLDGNLYDAFPEVANA